MQKIAGVQSVKVSLNDGLTILDLKPDNTVTLAKLRQVIKDNGFVAKEAQIVARGSTAVADGRPVFDVSGSKERLLLTMPARQVSDAWQLSIAAQAK
jgi:hypothetical protein